MTARFPSSPTPNPSRSPQPQQPVHRMEHRRCLSRPLPHRSSPLSRPWPLRLRTAFRLPASHLLLGTQLRPQATRLLPQQLRSRSLGTPTRRHRPLQEATHRLLPPASPRRLGFRPQRAQERLQRLLEAVVVVGTREQRLLRPRHRRPPWHPRDSPRPTELPHRQQGSPRLRRRASNRRFRRASSLRLQHRRQWVEQ
jgi:hypothetical protein